MSKTDRPDLEATIQRCYSTWGERYYADYYASEDAYPAVHTDIVRGLLQSEGTRSLLDAGCGPASMLRDLDLPGLERYGFDVTPEMIQEARRVLGRQDLSPERIWQGSVLDGEAFVPPGGAPAGGFEAANCFGVLPHIPAEADGDVIAHLRDALAPGGIMAVEARNELFGLFTLNRYSRALFRDRLIREDALAERVETPAEGDALAAALSSLDQRFRMDLPPLRGGYADEPGYDEVLSRTHNPFELRSLAEAAGLKEVRTLFYHYHALPPMLETEAPALFRRASLAMEDPTDWRGHVMASAFILVARKPR